MFSRFTLDFLYTVKRYYRSPKFAVIDLIFSSITLFSNPYRTCRKFLQKKGMKNIYAYGETPFATYQRIVQECEIGPEDTWIELGSGRGKGCFWLAHFVRCKVIGVEWIFQFVWISNLVRAIFRMKNLRFIHSDITRADLREATVIYLYGLELDFKVSSEVKVISISEPLQGFTVLKKFWVRYPWGRTTAFLQKSSFPPYR